MATGDGKSSGDRRRATGRSGGGKPRSGGGPRDGQGSGAGRNPHARRLRDPRLGPTAGRASGSRREPGRAESPRAIDPRRVDEPPIPEEVAYADLARDVRARLRGLSKENAENVGRRLVAVGLFLDDDPELAYRHAMSAVSRAGRVDVVREAAALAAYRTGRYAEALRELRTVRRLSNDARHLAVEADCERGLGRPERAIALATGDAISSLDAAAATELRIVLAGARMDLGDPAAALLVLRNANPPDGEARARVDEATVDVLRALGRDDEADRLAATLPDWESDDDEEVVVYDIDEEDAEYGSEDASATVADGASDASPDEGGNP